MYCEEWIAAGLVMDQLRQLRNRSWIAMDRVRDQTTQVFTTERRKNDLVHQRSCSTDGVELAHQRMSGIDLVVPIGADQ